MKKGTTSTLPVEVGIDLGLVSKVEFVFVQGSVRKEFEWPSEEASQINERTVGLRWTPDDKSAFKPSRVEMDTRITLKDSEDQPDTPIVSFAMTDTLFEG